MSIYHVPGLSIDPASLPPPLLTSEPGSFARHTFEERIPHIIQETAAQNAFPPEIAGALADLRGELLDGSIRELREEAPDVAFWDTVSQPYLGRSWLDVPWYWAETYLYRRLLEATRYFQPGHWQGLDPFAAQKRDEWQPAVAPRAVAAVLDGLPADLPARFAALLMASLWGNRIDLSYKLVADLGASAPAGAAGSHLLVDDSAAVWEYLRSGRRHLVLIADNAGTELAMDLALLDLLLSSGLVERVDLHLKPQPFFVSDAMPADVEAGLSALGSAALPTANLAAHLREHLGRGRLRLVTHWFYATSLFYYQLPEDLGTTLGQAGLVIVKGDANYRRLFGDAHWPYTTPFAPVLAYFPAPVVSLRTLKSELILGLRSGQPERLSAQDPRWLINGKRGVVQARF